MNNSPKEKATLRQDKPPFQITKPEHSIEQARAHLLGVCLLDTSYIQYLPAHVQLSCYGKFTLAMIKQGVGLEAIISYLEDYGLFNADEILINALLAVPDDVGLSRLFHQSLRVVCSHD